ncbi:MAG: mevalonate 5-phosphate dehydratase small subunit [Thermococcaceae archaeon]|jgi:hypothetical protein|uniref:DUF126 domain-containing protein n=1 Tax=Thermococcus TaxID=2263 RepID=UPI0005B26F64|nr:MULTISPECIES: DUF126 domain-containing protein [Thermococcus]KUJ98796.1 MAG: hypothetical protein XD43_1540 [Thermococcales archaeon 44_46]MDK2783993.1 mevalonate 5-phosphate dehydratase small subunit [Thermococcaceae archaeon]MCA6213635.1 DUF126 domain-containing protein [Thermococcus bergensis]MDN5321201.1 mevalonate 5-phosphate dehydratase small subunit [Thermococcaceae archaeon]HIH73027.1 DUF126 domain-containing protein [Thermococcaceae archaeon]
MKLKGRKITKGKARGVALVSKKPLSFLGGVDPKTGIVKDVESDIRGESIKDKILVFPRGKGSTVGSYVLYQLKKNGVAPKAIIVEEAETIVATGAIIAEIPMVDKVDISKIKSGQVVEVDADEGEVVIEE